MQNKLNSYIGFAKKSNSIIYGIDNLETTKKNVFLVIYSSNISDRSLNNLKNLIEKKKWKSCELFDLTLDDLLNTSNCKVIGITNYNLCLALEKELNNNI